VTAGALSHGQQRRLEVGMALAARPRAIFLDEPTSGMGVDDLEEMKRLIRSLRDDHTVVLIEHNMNIVMDISDTITVMQQGRVLVEGAPAAIRSDERVRAGVPGQHDHGRPGMILHVDAVHSYYGKSHILQGVSLALPQGRGGHAARGATARASRPRSRPSPG
jgi:ABC-type branched-subunit amino acid transport system ATPase component